MGGAEKILVNLANDMVSNGFDVTVQTLIDKGPLKDRLDKRVHYKTAIKSKNRYVHSIKLKLWSKLLSPAFLHKRYVKGSYDYEVAFLEGMPTKIISASKAKKYTWVHINLENSFASISNFKGIDEYKDAYSKFDKIICVSEDVKAGFLRQIGDVAPIEVLYNPLDVEAVINNSNENVKEIAGWDNSVFNLVSVGRLVKQKAYDRLVRIAKRLKDDGYKFAIRIIGDGENEKILRTQIMELGVSDCFELIGYRENPFPYVKASDLFVCSSVEEGFSTAVTEAIVLGVPVVTTDCSGMKEQFGELNCGKIVSNDEDELYLAIKEYFDNKSVRKEYKENVAIRSKYFIEQNRMQKIINLFE